MQTLEILQAVNAIKGKVNTASSAQKNQVLQAMADALIAQSDAILSANAQDCAAASHLSAAMQDRLLLTPERIAAMAEGVRQVAALDDPVGQVMACETLDNGLILTKRRVPMGVIAIIYESRPNVTSDAAALAIKSGNACVLRSGKDAFLSANAIVTALQAGLGAAGLPKAAVSLVQDTSHDSAKCLMRANGLVDLLIPRGGVGLIQRCVAEATVPCIETGTGVCHMYIDKAANLKMALDLVENAKASRPSVCNALEVCLVHQAVAADFLPKLAQRMADERKAQGLPEVRLRLHDSAAAFIQGERATEADFSSESLDYVLTLKVVASLEDAIAHIGRHSTHHSDAIVTEDAAAAARFVDWVDSAAVYVNASTRFTDGGCFGLGCEMGISTQKLHARGPMGLTELTSYKYIVQGTGQVR